MGVLRRPLNPIVVGAEIISKPDTLYNDIEDFRSRYWRSGKLSKIHC